MPTAIDTKYTSLGGATGFLGTPITGETTCPDGVGKFRHFQNGSIYWHPSSGAFEVHGLIRAKWAKLGWERSFLGYPKTDETTNSNNTGRFNIFQGGAITWLKGADEAFETHGAIRNKWGQFDFEKGFLGFATTDETKTPDGIGRFNHFQNGSIYWKPSISAHEIHGLIRDLWASLGWERNAELGYPISDELPTKPGSGNRYSDFENGIIFWKSGTSRASTLSKIEFDLQHNKVSLSVAEVMQKMNDIIIPLIKADPAVYIKNGPYLADVTDYSFDGNKVHNRRYKVHVDVGIDIPTIFMPDATSSLDLWIEIDYDRAQKKVFAYLVNWRVHTSVPFPSSTAVSAATINGKFSNALNPKVWQPIQIMPAPGADPIPDYVNILSLKIMGNGDLNVYVEPLCAVTTACMNARGLGDNCMELETLRSFRDSYVSKSSDGKKLIDEYYWIAPRLVENISRTKQPAKVYEKIYREFIQPLVSFISQNDFQKAYLLCRKAVDELKRRYYR